MGGGVFIFLRKDGGNVCEALSLEFIHDDEGVFC